MTKKKSLIKYLFSRLMLLPIMIWLISTFVFFLLRIAPGDPIDAILGTKADESAREILREKLGLNQTLLEQYFSLYKPKEEIDLESIRNREKLIYGGILLAILISIFIIYKK